MIGGYLILSSDWWISHAKLWLVQVRSSWPGTPVCAWTPARAGMPQSLWILVELLRGNTYWYWIHNTWYLILDIWYLIILYFSHYNCHLSGPSCGFSKRARQPLFKCSVQLNAKNSEWRWKRYYLDILISGKHWLPPSLKWCTDKHDAMMF